MRAFRPEFFIESCLQDSPPVAFSLCHSAILTERLHIYVQTDANKPPARSRKICVFQRENRILLSEHTLNFTHIYTET